MPLTTSSAPRQLSDGNSVGTVLGTGPTDKIGFYNNTGGVVQPSGNAQAAVARGVACGTVATFSTSQSPTSVATLTTAELGMTVIGGTGASVSIATGDLLFVNKPTAQAGVGVGNVRVSAANTAGVTFSNLSAGFLTPTTTETYGIVALRGFNALSATLTPAAVAPKTTAEQTFTVTGLRAGELVQVSKPTAQAGLDIAGARVISNNTLGITFMNVTSATTLTPTAAESYTVISLGGMDAENNNVLYQVSANAVTGVGAATTAQRNITITNLAVSDVVLGVQKPTLQAGLLAGGALVSSAGWVGITFANVTSAATLTPTANEVYGVGIYRPAPVAPLVIYNQTLTPVSIAANTTAEQTFTVTGLISSTPAWVNKPSPTPGLGITGVRVSSTNNIGITFDNPTSAAITPPSESYIIGNFQMPIDAVGNSIIQTASLVSQEQSVLSNAMRTALTTTGLIAGA